MKLRDIELPNAPGLAIHGGTPIIGAYRRSIGAPVLRDLLREGGNDLDDLTNPGSPIDDMINSGVDESSMNSESQSESPDEKRSQSNESHTDTVGDNIPKIRY